MSMRIPARKSSMANATIRKIALMKITINKMGFVSNKLHAIILKFLKTSVLMSTFEHVFQNKSKNVKLSFQSSTYLHIFSKTNNKKKNPKNNVLYQWQPFQNSM